MTKHDQVYRKLKTFYFIFLFFSFFDFIKYTVIHLVAKFYHSKFITFVGRTAFEQKGYLMQDMIYQDSTAGARNITDFSPNSFVFVALFESNKICAFLTSG